MFKATFFLLIALVSILGVIFSSKKSFFKSDNGWVSYLILLIIGVVMVGFSFLCYKTQWIRLMIRREGIGWIEIGVWFAITVGITGWIAYFDKRDLSSLFLFLFISTFCFTFIEFLRSTINYGFLNCFLTLSVVWAAKTKNIKLIFICYIAAVTIKFLRGYFSTLNPPFNPTPTQEAGQLDNVGEANVFVTVKKEGAVVQFTPDVETAIGVVIAVSTGQTDRRVGELVAYAAVASYSDEQILPANKVVPVPSSIDPTIAASVLLNGMITHFLIRRCFKVDRGHAVLVHDVVGGVESLLCRWANALGATVIGALSNKEKADQAKEDGCHHVLIYEEENFVDRVNEITSGKGVEVVYDSVGKDTFEGSLACLKYCGYMVSFGESSGAIDPVPLSTLELKSLYLTKPSMMHYTATTDQLLEIVVEVFKMLHPM